jgi:16S rRNA (uracil1498-N3)-methyltransferase
MRPRTCFVSAAVLMSNEPTRPDAKLLHYLGNVLRLSDGHPLWLRDEAGRRRQGCWRVGGGGMIEPQGEVVEATAGGGVAAGGPALWLAPALIKGHRLDWLMEKATELGAERIGFTATARAVVQWGADDFVRKLPRMEQQLEAAATQSGAPLPALDAPEPLAARARGWVAQGARLLVAHPGARATVVEAAQGAAVVGLMCGPEGGYTDAEVTTLIEQGALPVTLGPHILRAETAAVAMLAALRLQAW